METRRILLDGVPTTVTREGDELVAPDGRVMPLDDPIHLPVLPWPAASEPRHDGEPPVPFGPWLIGPRRWPR